MEKLRGNEMQQLHKDLQALRHELQKCRGNEERLQQSCEDRRDVEEGIVRDDIPGSRNLGSRDYDYGRGS